MEILPKDDLFEIEFDNNKTIKINLIHLRKYPHSKLASYFFNLKKIPKRNQHIFLDRSYNTFNLLLKYLETGKIPQFSNKKESVNFFKELDYWGINLKIENKKHLEFNSKLFNNNNFTVNKLHTILKKMNKKKGIVLLEKKLNLYNPYIEFYMSKTENKEKNIIYLALIEESKFNPKFLVSSFNNDETPFVFLWDIFGNIIFRKNGNICKDMKIDDICRCHLNFQVNKFGLKYDQLNSSLELLINDINLGVVVKNIQPNLTPAIEVNSDGSKIELLNNNIQEERIYL